MRRRWSSVPDAAAPSIRTLFLTLLLGQISVVNPQFGVNQQNPNINVQPQGQLNQNIQNPQAGTLFTGTGNNPYYGGKSLAGARGETELSLTKISEPEP